MAAGKAGLLTHAGALFRKNAIQQRRAWKTNLGIVATPLLFCGLLAVLQATISKALDTPANKCGCSCAYCCSQLGCRNATERPCAIWEACEAWDTTQCGFKYSSGLQAMYCPVPTPSSWPPMLQVPTPARRAVPWGPSVAVLYTGANRSAAEGIARALFPAPRPTQAQVAQARAWFDQGSGDFGGQQSGSPSVYASAVSLLGVTLGTWQREGGYPSNLIEPAFVASNHRGEQYNATLYMVVPDASDSYTQLVHLQLRGFMWGAAAGLPQGRPGLALAEAEPVWQDSAAAIGRRLFCGYREATCNATDAAQLEGPPGGEEEVAGAAQQQAAEPGLAQQATQQAWRPGEVQEVAQAYDFGDSGPARLALRMWYNATGRFGGGGGGSLASAGGTLGALASGSAPDLVRVNQGLNSASNAFLRWALGANYSAQLVGILDFPKGESQLSADISAILGPLFFTWACQLLLPLIVVNLVHEKEARLRTMVKMHGLGDAAYWAIQYAWFLALNLAYTAALVGCGSAIGLSFFRRTSYTLQLVLYFLWSNCLVAFSFLLSTLFRSSRTAVVACFLYVFGTGLVGLMLLEHFLSRNHWWVVFMELVPGFGLYGALYEISQYSFRATYQDTWGMTWARLAEPGNGLGALMGLFVGQWAAFLLLAWYLEQVLDTGIGAPRHPLFFLGRLRPGNRSTQQQRWGNMPSTLEQQQQQQRSSEAGGSVAAAAAALFCGSASADGCKEAAMGASKSASSEETVVEVKVEGRGRSSAALSIAVDCRGGEHGGERGGGGRDSCSAGSSDSRGSDRHSRGSEHSSGCSSSIVIQDLWKVFPAAGGNKERAALGGLSLDIQRGECFGVLGPNGAGKSTMINILTGFMEPTAGTASVEGLDIRQDMASIYSLMGVCPQHDLLWESLTAREHLQFYGRLKNLKGEELAAAVDAALRSVNLYRGGVADKQVGAYSGGMKRRLSVAIALIGDPSVVYLDEPSTGLDPASRHNLWDVVKQAKAGRGIILTTHSMEEAAQLCDRLGIFVEGRLACCGSPQELTARLGGYYVFTVTTPPEAEPGVEALVRGLAPAARLTYSLAGTQKYELPADQVSLPDVFERMEGAKVALGVVDWGIANASLEEVFIKFAQSVGADSVELH